jgi:hypothetical protein
VSKIKDVLEKIAAWAPKNPRSPPKIKGNQGLRPPTFFAKSLGQGGQAQAMALAAAAKAIVSNPLKKNPLGFF